MFRCEGTNTWNIRKVLPAEEVSLLCAAGGGHALHLVASTDDASEDGAEGLHDELDVDEAATTFRDARVVLEGGAGLRRQDPFGIEEDLEDETEELVDLELDSLDDALTDSVSQLLDGTGEIEFEMAQEVIGVEMETVVDVTDEAVADAMASAEAAASEAAADVAAEVTADVAIDASIAEVGADVGLEVALDACIAICWM